MSESSLFSDGFVAEVARGGKRRRPAAREKEREYWRGGGGCADQGRAVGG